VFTTCHRLPDVLFEIFVEHERHLRIIKSAKVEVVPQLPAIRFSIIQAKVWKICPMIPHETLNLPKLPVKKEEK
jgi:hypothetical protein